ncbi:MAG TPA: hypothetical protein VE980_12115 [Pyrinomonadaceae bacterium]|nr:hypothetical protein [Pyrinomonadaceae bacterium]
MARYWCAFVLLLMMGQVCLAQNTQDETSFAKQRATELIADLPAQIKKVDDATVRVFLQLRLATFHWSELSENSRDRARELTLSGLQDLDKNRSDLLPLYGNSFREDLLALLEVHAPDLAARYRTGGDTTEKVTPGDPYDVALSMLRTKGQAALAVQTFTRALNGGEAPTMAITFFLSELQRQQPSLMPQILSDILSAQERRPETLSVEMLFWLVDPYIWRNDREDIKRRFVSAVVAATADSYQWSDRGRLSEAFNLLRVTVPLIQKLLPGMYPQAAAQLATVRARLPNETVESSAIRERIRQSEDRLNQIITEANSASSASVKNDLLIQAAQVAFTEKKPQLAFDLAMSVSTDDNNKDWRQQFLSELVKGAVENKDAKLGLTIASKIEMPLARAEALQRLALLFFNLKDLWKAKELLVDSLKLVRGSDNTPEKAIAFLRSLRVIARIDQAMVPDVAEESIKTLNALQFEPNSRALMEVVWNTMPSFEALVQWDELGALNFVEKIQRIELRTVASFGAAKGILTTANAKEALPKKHATKS